MQKVARARNHHDCRTRLVTLPAAKRLTEENDSRRIRERKGNKQLNFSKISRTVLPALAPEIDFGGKKYALAFGDEATMTESASQSSSQ